MKNILITTLPFAKFDKSSINLLKKNNINYYWNPKNKKFSRNELLKIIHKFDIETFRRPKKSSTNKK